MGARKSLKNFQKTSKICEFPSREPQNRDERCPKALVNKGPRKQRQAQNQMADSSRTIQEEPLLTEGLCAYRERIEGTEKEGHSPTEHSVPNTQYSTLSREEPLPFYMYRED